ncbi:uncharacterized protein LOC126832705 [Patella vulgata]|uniref:uncharacterized protein LOC126832705 n=1 Tax=Patella vulgata TaxID=6465 RepID=UPI0024A7CC07|nr:uncharacterized protein LOC126832705 [Patella vulgata]
MRDFYGKDPSYRKADMTINYLGYWTDNGATYFWNTEPHKSYEQTIYDRFWNDLFKESKLWGLTVYEQDFMSVNTDTINATVSDVYSGKSWLMDMGNAARMNGLTIQYCMGYPRHVMTALEIPVVTQGRVLFDNRPSSDHWTIGVSSLFAEAMGIAPYKDDFWSMEVQPGNGYSKYLHTSDLTEPHTAIHGAISTLSTGPVGPSDQVGNSNVSLIMRCCNTEGLILKPSKPITAIDKQIQQMAFGGNVGPEGKVYTTYSNINNYIFGVILAANISIDYTLMVQDTGINMVIF